MNIERALALKPGQPVHCPPDRGEPAYRGIVQVYGDEDYLNSKIEIPADGKQYIWVSVKGVGRTSVWPSNRLELA